MSWAVEVKNLTKIFGEVIALNNINLRLEKGKIHVIAGPNGAGKTTFLRILYTELLPTTGEVKVLSYDIYKDAAEIRKHIDVLPQEIMPFNILMIFIFLIVFLGLSRAGIKWRVK
jgi:ABC-2 type transport system ATP-binding protein